MTVTLNVAPPIAKALEVPESVSDTALAERLATLADANPPSTDAEIEVWTEFERALEEALLHRRGESLDDAEAAHYVVANAERRTQSQWVGWVAAFSEPGGGQYSDETRSDPDTRLRLMMFRLLPRLADEIGFRLV